MFSSEIVMQDVMLSGGSDAAIIPIGISFLLYLCWFYLSMHLLVIAWILHNLLFSCWCRLGRFCGMQSTFPEEQWSYKSITSLGQCMLSIILLHWYQIETPKYTGSIQGWTNQKRTLQKSSKFKIEEKGWFLHTENQSNKVWKNRSLRSGMERSMSSKHLLFLSFQIHHIKQRGMAFQISPLRWRPKWPCQQAKSLTTDIGMT